MNAELRDLQQQFQRYLLTQDSKLDTALVASSQTFVKQRLAIYSEGYYFRLIDILAEDYPMLQRYVGEQNFIELARAYIQAYPSQTPIIRYFGAGFANFLTQVKHAEAVFLSEMARFEWALAAVFDAADEMILKVESLTTIAPEAWPHTLFIPQQHAQLIEFEWNVPPIWQALKAANTALKASAEKAQQWLVWRADLQCHFIELTALEAWVWRALPHTTFGVLCEQLCEWLAEAEVANYIGQLILRWMRAHLLTRYVINS